MCVCARARATPCVLQVVPHAHDTPLQCLEYCADRSEVATCAMGNKVKIWDVSRPATPRHVLTLDHAEGDPDRDGGPDSPTSPARRSNMTWLTRSDVAGAPHATGIVLETIQTANRDVPEVTHVRLRLPACACPRACMLACPMRHVCEVDQRSRPCAEDLMPLHNGIVCAPTSGRRCAGWRTATAG